MKRLYNRIIAFLLTIALVVPMLAAGVVPARAESIPASSGKPELFIDFLGHSIPAHAGETVTVAAPANTNQAWSTSNTDGWKKYGPAGGGTEEDVTSTVAGTVFWVGVGIDKMAAFQLAKGGKGLYGVELGFYYNSEFVEPYTGTDSQTFADVITEYNLGTGNTKNQWDSAYYRVAEALTGLTPVGDPNSQDEPAPTDPSWKMTYVSIQKVVGDNDVSHNRFSNLDTTNVDTQYIVMIPFVLRKHDANEKLCFKLVRNAGIFSIGGGQYGYTIREIENTTSDYGAWERTTRNTGHNLKQMFDFTGDLNIFTGGKEVERYDAQLILNGVTDTGNKAALKAKGDPFAQAVTEVTVAKNPKEDTLAGLYPGTTMELKLKCVSGTSAEVTVADRSAGTISVTAVEDDKEYTFVMPNNDVTVTVNFNQSLGDKYKATLETVGGDESLGNTAKLKIGEKEYTAYPVEVVRQTPVEIMVDRNSEYDVSVAVKTPGGDNIAVTTDTPNEKYSFKMPSSDVTATVTYTKAHQYDARLAVDQKADGLTANAAKLSYTTDEGDTVESKELDQALGGAGDTGGTSTIQARDGRTMIVDLKVDPDYIAVVTLTYLDSGTSETLAISPLAAGGTYQYQATFEMPEEDVEVKVDFTKAAVVTATLNLINTEGQPGNTATLEGKDATGTHTAAGQNGSITVIAGTKVKIDLSTASDYKVKEVKIVRQDNVGDTVGFTGTYAGGELEFVTPSGDSIADVVVEVTYEKGARNIRAATLKLVPESPSKGVWDDNGLEKFPLLNAEVGTEIEAKINVEPGWYIDSMTVQSATASYSATLSGNGYNGGAGKTETVTMTMPDDDILMTVTLKKGPPPVTATSSVTLIVNDAENTGETPADNWAKLSVDGGTTWQPTDGQKKDSTHTVITSPDVKPGDKVRVKVHAADGFKLDKDAPVVVGPASAGIVPKWIDSETLEFTQPDGHTTVTVNFVKGNLTEDDAYTATLHMSPADQGTATLTNTRTAAPVLADKIANADDGIVHAFAGDKLKIEASGADSFYVTAVYVVDQNGAVVALTPPLPERTPDPQSGEFTMPAGNVDVYVEYGSAEPPMNGHTAVLTVKGPEGEAAGTAGSATLKLGYGDTTVRAESNGDSQHLTAIAGSTMTVEIAPETGYGIEVVTITPDGVATLDWTGTNTVEFTMPGEDVGVVVRLVKGTGTQYTADIVMRLPDGTTVEQAGDARFENGEYSIVKAPGSSVPVTVAVKPGYYLDHIEITPAGLGVTAEYGGVYASETAGFTMPAGNVTVNVYIKKGWPGMSDLPVTLNVVGPAGVDGNTAALANQAADRAANKIGPLEAGENGATTAWDGDSLVLDVTAADGYTWTLELKDAEDQDVSYTWSGLNQVSFDMPATGLTATVTFAVGEDKAHTAALSDASKADGTLKNETTNETGTSVEARRGETVTVTATRGQRLAAVLVTGKSGTAVPLSGAITGNTASFVMPDEDVTVDLVLGSLNPDTDGYAAVLQLSGPDGAGSGTITDGNATRSANCPGGAALSAVVKDQTVTVKPIANTGYVIDHIEVISTDTTLTYTWDWQTVEFAMPAADVTVLVAFREATEKDEDGYTAQLVVDNSGNEANKAKLYKAGSDPAGGGDKLTGLRPGEEVTVDITVAPGSSITLVSVTPTKYGVAVNPLTPPVTMSQTTSFRMPAGDVIVFVQFEGDAMARYDVTMTVGHGPNSTANDGNTASLTTPVSGTLPAIKDGETSVGRAGNGETVTVVVTVADGYYAVVEAKDSLDNIVAVTQTEADGNKFQFTMPNSATDVTVTFNDKEKDPPAVRRAYLHISGNGAGDSATITLRDSDPVVSTSVNNDFIEGGQGAKVDLSATAGDGRYIKEAYVMYGTIVLDLTLPGDGRDGATKILTDDFILQAGDVHVYVVFAADAEKPENQEFDAVLTVTGPAGEAVGAAGRATMTAGEKTAGPILSNATTVFTPVGEPNPVTVPATGTLTLKPGEQVTVDVTVEVGYELDLIVLTPLSLNLTAAPAVDAGGKVIEGKYTFTMPDLTDLVPPSANVGVEVRLKTGDLDNIHKVTFHLTDPSVGKVNKAKVTFGHQIAQADREEIKVPTGEKVPITVKPAANHYVKYAYVLQDSAMVPTDPALSGYNGTTEKTGEFEMPGGDSDAYLVFAEGTPPITPEYAVVLTVTDPTPNGGANKVTLSNGHTAANPLSDGSTGITAPSDGQHYTLSAQEGDEMTMVMTLLDGYTVKSITVTPTGRSITPTQDPQDKNRYTFHMPAGDISILVELTTGELNTYTAALHVVDESTAIGNKVTMSDGKGHTVSAGHMLTGLAGTENLRINATLQDDVKIAKVLYTTTDGTKVLTNPSGAYYYPMTTKDVTITVYLTDDPERGGNTTYFVTVEETGRDGRPDNSAAIRNTSEPGMPSGPSWTAVHAGNNAELEITTADGYYVQSVTAVNNKDNSAVRLIPTGDKRYILTAPAADVTVKVVYGTTAPTPTTGSISLGIDGVHGSLAANTATLALADDSKTVTVDGGNPADQTLSDVPAGALLKLTTGTDANYYVSGATLTVGAKVIHLTLRAGVAELYMPELAAGETAKVTVTFAAGVQSPRPYDPENTDNSANGYQKGWLEGENLGNGKLRITVDSLTANEGVNLENTDNTAFKLYLWNGLEQTELVRGTDYELMTDPYERGDYSDSETIQGSRFTIRSLIGGSALSEAVANGGLLYISASKDGAPESERVELVVPADTGRYAATLRIVDLSGIPGNGAEMSVDGQTAVNVSGQSITGLLGTETVRTVVKLAPGARLVSVTATETSGTTLLSRSPADAEPQRYAWDMTGRNVIITVRIEKEPPENDPNGPMYQATVVKVDDHELLKNDADIFNDSIPTMGRGVIWSYGYEGNVMRVEVGTEEGYYATVTAKEKTTGDPVTVLQSDYTVHTTGTTGTFDALVTMPADDVQITVTYSKTAPEKYFNKLTLKMEESSGTADGNTATVTWGESKSLSVYGGASPVLMATTTETLATGTQLTLRVSAATGATPQDSYYISKVTLEVPGVMSTTLTPDRNGEVSFATPYGGDATLTVTYAKGEQMPQPHDPAHTGSTVYEDGWIVAKSTVDDTQHNHQVEVTVPTLIDGKDILSNAFAGSAADTTDIAFQIYYRDAFGQFNELVQSTDGSTGDILISQITKVTKTYAGQPYDGASFTVTCLRRGGFLAEIFKQGGLLYITAVDGKGVKGESRYTELVIPANHSATLYITDTSGIGGNTVTLGAPGQSVNENGKSLTSLRGDETLTTSVTRKDGVKIASVVVSDRTGTRFLTPGSISNQYDYPMVGEDVDVSVQLVKEDDSNRIYRATVIRADGDDLADNTASVANTTDGALDRGSIWTDAREGDVVEVTVSTAMGYYATVTAKNVDDNTAIPVRQTADTGDFTAQVQMPAGNVEITVTYSKTKPDPGKLTLTVKSGNGTATIFKDGASLLDVNNATDTKPTDGPKEVQVGTTLELKATAAAGQYLKEAKLVIVLESGASTMSTTLRLVNGHATFQMPLSSAEVQVYFDNGEKTPRPYDPTHTGSDKGYTDGWLEAENQGGTAVKIGVPTLFDDVTLSNADNVTYKLYYKDALDNYQCVDGHVTVSDAASKGIYPGYTGWEFTATSERTSTALDKILKDGGLLYITATENGKGESEYTEVQVLSSDQKTYTATFKVVDMATDQTSTYNLNDGKGHTVSNDGDTITGLLGGEHMTTTVTKLGTNVKIQAVTMTTKAGGTVLLSAGSGAANIFDATMPAADATFTVFLEDGDDETYIATVQTVDSTGVTGNTAQIVNATDSAARKGEIWSAGRLGDDMVVSFTTGNGVYAVVTATKRTEGNEDITVLQIGVTGSGKAYFDMPAANVQVTVTFTTTPPPDAELTLELAGHGGVAENMAAVYQKASADATVDPGTATALLKLAGAPGAADPLTAKKAVTPGSYLKVITGHGDAHTVKTITITVTTKDGYVLDLPVTDGATEVQMPLNAATITVTFQPGKETGRPYDPNHAIPASPGTQAGWLEGEGLGGGAAKVIVPTIGVYQPPAEGATTGTYDLQNANNHDFALYLFSDALGTYVKLEIDKDYTVSDQKTTEVYYTDPGPDKAEETADDISYRGTEFVIHEVDGGRLKGLLDKGVTLYITATDKEKKSPPWTESQRTELIIPSNASGLRPYDPERVNAAGIANPTYADHWIKADNRGDYALITVPTLANESDELFDVTAEFSFEICIKDGDAYISLSEITEQLHPDGAAATPYKLDTFYTAPATASTAARPYTGAQFVLKLKDTAGMPADKQALADRVQEILRDGTDPERLYIKSIKTTTVEEVTTTEESSLVDMEVGPIYTLSGKLESYAPQHAATFSFYAAINPEGNLNDPANYETDPTLTFEVVHNQGKRLWTLDFDLSSSELLGAWMLVVTKPGHVEYRQLGLVLSEDTLDTAGGTTFTFTDPLALIGGDVDQDGAVTLLDREIVMAFADGSPAYTRDREEDPGWDDSIYNPESPAYAADLDGDGMMSMMDLSVIMHERNYNMSQANYTAPLTLQSAAQPGP